MPALRQTGGIFPLFSPILSIVEILMILAISRGDTACFRVENTGD
jgi:hypothetical protein